MALELTNGGLWPVSSLVRLREPLQAHTREACSFSSAADSQTGW